MRPVVGASIPQAIFSRVVLPAPFGPTRPTTCPGGISRVQSASAWRWPYLLPSALGLQYGAHFSSSALSRKVFWNIASMPGSVRPAARALASQSRSSLLERAVLGERGLAQGPGDEGAHPGLGRGQAQVLEFAVGLAHGVRVDRHLGDHLLDRGQLVALGEQPQQQRLAYLPDDLQVRGDPGARVEMEARSPYSHSTRY